MPAPSKETMSARSERTIERRPRRGDAFEVAIDRLSAEGLGEAVLRLASPSSGPERRYTLQVRGALPGERVIAEVGRRRGRRFFARARALVSRSPERVAPRCLHFEHTESDLPGCGGCSLQSLPYSAQLRLKRERVVHLLTEAGFDGALVADIVAQQEPWYYRNKMEYSFHPPPTGPVVLGLHPAGSHAVLSLSECHLLSPFASQLLPRVERWAVESGLSAYWPRRDSGFLRTLTIREGKRTGERMVELTTSADENVTTCSGPRAATEIVCDLRDRLLEIARQLEAQISSICWTQQVAVKGQPTRFITHALHGDAVLHEALQVADDHLLRFEIHPRAFFQPATLQAERLYLEILSAADLLGAVEKIQAVDLYCGTGTIALTLAPYCRRVVGIELNPTAVENAARNALFNGIDNARFIAGDVGQVLRSGALAAELPSVELAVVDPPRSGLEASALAAINAIAAPRLIYVSCNPTALARDLLELARLGYKLRSVRPVDMFPQTAHVESVARLDRPSR
jgi:23S rRNA (uracil1939-C5)-methyltransferase